MRVPVEREPFPVKPLEPFKAGDAIADKWVLKKTKLLTFQPVCSHIPNLVKIGSSM
jgi:hypothetical protein